VELKQKSDVVNPYAAPESGDGPRPPAGGGGDGKNHAWTGKIDLGAALRYPFQDSGWFGKSALVGLILFIPIVGYLVMLGWMQRIYEGAKRGDTILPSMDFGEDLSRGVKPFVAILNLALVSFVLIVIMQIIMMPIALLGAGLQEAGGGEVVGVLMGLMMMVVNLLFFAVMIGINLLVPEIWRRGFHGEMGPLFSFGSSMRAIRKAIGPYLLVVLSMFVINMIGSLGVFACYIGMFVTLPLSLAMFAHLIAQWDGLVSEQAA
jgi:hypothetical protein